MPPTCRHALQAPRTRVAQGAAHQLRAPSTWRCRCWLTVTPDTAHRADCRTGRGRGRAASILNRVSRRPTAAAPRRRYRPDPPCPTPRSRRTVAGPSGWAGDAPTPRPAQVCTTAARGGHPGPRPAGPRHRRRPYRVGLRAPPLRKRAEVDGAHRVECHFCGQRRGRAAGRAVRCWSVVERLAPGLGQVGLQLRARGPAAQFISPAGAGSSCRSLLGSCNSVTGRAGADPPAGRRISGPLLLLSTTWPAAHGRAAPRCARTSPSFAARSSWRRQHLGRGAPPGASIPAGARETRCAVLADPPINLSEIQVM